MDFARRLLDHGRHARRPAPLKRTRREQDPSSAGGPFRDEGAKHVQGERVREREAAARAENAESLVFAGQLRRRTWALVLLAGLLGAGATVALLGPWHARSSAAPAIAAPRALGAAECATLASRYKAAWQARNACLRDDECVATPRGGYWTGLEGCVRFGPANASSVSADAIADAWLTGGCARSYSLCGAAGGTPHAPADVQCRAGACTELPPAPVPREWSRIDAQLFQFFGPPDLQGGRALVDDGVGFRYARPGLQLTIEYDDYAPVDIRPEDSPEPIIVTRRASVSLPGHVATDVAFEARALDGGAHSYRRVLAMQDAPCQEELTFSTCERGPLAGSSTTKLAMWVTCDRPEACDDARVAFQSIVFP